MDISIILGPFLPSLPGPAGAVEKIWQGIGERLSLAGHKVTIIEKAGAVHHPDGGGLIYQQVRGYDRPFGMFRTLLCDFIYSHRALAVVPNSDIIISNTFFLPTIFMLPQRIIKTGGLGLLIPSIARMPKGQLRLFRKVSAITTVSNAAKQAIISELRRSEVTNNVYVIPNPVDTSVFHSIGRASKPTRRILFAGRIAPEKGVKQLVSAFVKLRKQGHMPNFELIVIGPHEVSRGGGGSGYFEACKAGTEGHPIQFLPTIHDPKLLAEEMRLADFFAYPSLAEKGETFGVSVLEAMACGAVAMVSDLACFQDFVTDGSNGFVFDHRLNVEATLEKTLLKISKSDDISGMSRNAATTARMFSYEAITAQYEKLLFSLIKP